MRYKNLVGKIMGRISIIDRAQNRFTPAGNLAIYYKCKCACGNVKEIRGISLTRRDHPTTSCGCKRVEAMKKQTGANNPAWKGGERIETGGYIEVYAPSHPNTRANGYVKKHRIVMEKHIGRYLHKNENVHHKNGDRADNRISNLELWNTSQPSGQRAEDKIEWAKEILKLYNIK